MANKTNKTSRKAKQSVWQRKMFFTMLWRAALRRRSRAMMAIVATLVGATTLFGLASICVAVPAQMNAQMRAYGANLVVSPVSGDGSAVDISTEQAEQIEAQIVELSASSSSSNSTSSLVYSARYRYETVRINNGPYMVAGIAPEQVQNMNQHWTVEGDWPSAGNVMIGRDVADAIGAEIGSTITIGYRESDNSNSGEESSDGDEDSDSSSNSDSESVTTDSTTLSSTTILDTSGIQYRVAGIVDTGGSEDEIVYLVGSDLDELSGLSRGFDVLEYSISGDSEQIQELATALSELTFEDLQINAQAVTRITTADTRIITMLQTLFWLVSVVILVLTLVGVSTTMTAIVAERRSEIGLRKALGASAKSIGLEFYAESFCYGLVGGVLGTMFGFLLALLLCQSVFDTALSFNWLLGILSIVVAILVAVAASYLPVRRASLINPAIVLREE